MVTCTFLKIFLCIHLTITPPDLTIWFLVSLLHTLIHFYSFVPNSISLWNSLSAEEVSAPSCTTCIWEITLISYFFTINFYICTLINSVGMLHISITAIGYPLHNITRIILGIQIITLLHTLSRINKISIIGTLGSGWDHKLYMGTQTWLKLRTLIKRLFWFTP